MKIATKITAGYGILIALTIGLLMYHVSLIHRMEKINLNLSEVHARAAMNSLRLSRDLDQVEEFTRKSVVLDDPRYAAEVKELQDLFTRDLQKLRSLGVSAKEQAEIDRLSRMWDEYLESASRATSVIGGPPPAETESLLSSLIDHLNRLRSHMERVDQVIRESIESQVAQSAATGQRAEQVSIMAAAVALLLSFLVSFLIVRSISEPLGRLTEGTRAIAEGKFSYRLDIQGKDELSQLARDFNMMAQRLDELDELKKDFVSHVSHELKAPLASMQETTYLLLEEIPGPLTEKQRRLLQLHLQGGKRLSAMINNLLDLSRMEAGAMDYELKKQDLVMLVRAALAELEVRAREKGLRVKAELLLQPLIVECDGDRIMQVISNLLENALKFSLSGTTIGIRVRFAPAIPWHIPPSWRQRVASVTDGKGYALVAVSDSGPGVPDSHKERVFQKFHQVRQGRKIAGQGVGLGLAICHTIVETHRGAIWVEDNAGGGSVFFVLLPAEAIGNQVASSPPI